MERSNHFCYSQSVGGKSPPRRPQGEASMEPIKAFLLGVMFALTPSMLVLALVLMKNLDQDLGGQKSG
jgi:hypothetical protein